MVSLPPAYGAGSSVDLSSYSETADVVLRDGTQDMTASWDVGAQTITNLTSLAIGADSVTPDVILELISTTAAFIPPKMTTTQQNAIGTPVEGMYLHNTTTGDLTCYDGASWVAVGGGSGTGDLLAAGTVPMTADWNYGGFELQNVSALHIGGTGAATHLLEVETATGGAGALFGNMFVGVWDTAPTLAALAHGSGTLANDYALLCNSTGATWINAGSGEKIRFLINDTTVVADMTVTGLENVLSLAVGTTAAATSSIVDITSTTAGFLPPRMTTTQRNAIATPATGLYLHNTTTGDLECYDGASWVAVGGGAGSGDLLADGTVPMTADWNFGGFDLTNVAGLGVGLTPQISVAHIYEDTANVDATAGLTIEQDGAGDAVCQWLLTGGQRYVAGIDNSASDAFRIAPNADLSTNATGIHMSSAGFVGFGVAPDALYGLKSVGNIQISNANPQFVFTGTSAAALYFISGTSFQIRQTSGTEFAFRFQNSFVMKDESAGSLIRARILGANFGIGAPAPSDLFHVTTAGNANAVRVNDTSGFTGLGIAPVSACHVYQTDTAVSTTAGLTIEQGSTGDAICQWLLTGGQRYVAGIDNSVTGDPWRLAPNADLSTNALGIHMASTGFVGIGAAPATGEAFHITTSGSTDAFRVDNSTGSSGFNVDPVHANFHETPVLAVRCSGNSNGIHLILNTTDLQTQNCTITTQPYNKTHQGVGFLWASNVSTQNKLNIGGGFAGLDAATDIQFYVAPSPGTATGTLVCRIDENGLQIADSGITATTSAPLHLSGTGVNVFQRFENTGTGNARFRMITNDAAGDAYIQYELVGGNTFSIGQNSGQGEFKISTGATVLDNSVININSSGQLGIGDSPSALFHVIAAGSAHALRVNDTTGRTGVGAAAGSAQLLVQQAGTTAAVPVLSLDQKDVSEQMVEFLCTIGTGNAVEAIGAKTLTTTHFVKVTLTGGLTRYIPVGTIA